MSKKVFLLLVSILLTFSFDAFGWATNETSKGFSQESHDLAEHRRISDKLFTSTGFEDWPYLKPYVVHDDKLNKLGLDIDSFIEVSNTERSNDDPELDRHYYWRDFDTLGELFAFPPDDANFGGILHATEDSGSAGHTPSKSYWTNELDEEGHEFRTDAHNAMEDTANYKIGTFIYNIPVLPYDYLLKGSYLDKVAVYEADSYTTAANYGRWYFDYDPLGGEYGDHDYHTVPVEYVNAHMGQSLRATVAIASQYFDYYEVAEPGSTMARWSFNESFNGIKQICVNSKGSIAAPLFLGSSNEEDSHDPPRSSGGDPWWDGGAGNNFNYSIMPKYYDEVGDYATDYARDTGTWSWLEREAVCPWSSYTVEVVFSVKEYIQSTTNDNRFMGIVTYRDTAPDPDKYLFRLYTYKELVGTVYKTRLHFMSKLIDDSQPSVVLQTTEKGMPILDFAAAGNKDRWYYAAAVFHYQTGTMDLILRDMETGQTISQQGAMGVACGMSAEPTPDFYVGTQFAASRGFKGQIDDVRISNRDLVLDSDRLVSSTVAHWRFDEDNISEDEQKFYNAKGVDVDLQNGNSSGTDDHDLTYYTNGFYDEMVAGENYLAEPVGAKYARSTTLPSDLVSAQALRMQKSYSIEAVFNVDSFPTDGDSTNKEMGIVAYRDYNLATARLYLIKTYKDSSGHPIIRFEAQHDGYSDTTITVNTDSSPSPITPDEWYYVGVFYDDNTSSISLQLRHLESGAGFTTSAVASHPIHSLAATPNPVLLVGSQNMSNTSFNGRIDDVRISNDCLTPKDRLYMNGSTIAHWKFDYDYATAGQVIDNVDNDLLCNLHLGETFDIDDRDAVIEPRTGWFGGSLRSQSYVDNGNITKYASSEGVWSHDEAEAMAFYRSYSIETVFKVDSFPTTGGGANTEMGLVTYRDYKDESTGDDDVTLYEIKTYKNSSGHTCIKFSSVYNTNGDKKDILWDTLTDSGYTIPTDKWLYLGAFFNDTTHTMDLYLKNLETGIPYPPKTGASMNLPVGLSGNPTPVLLIGSNTRGSRCFDGWIDEVRISNEDLPADCRLYNYPR
jgi:hypothetical protein